MRLKDPVGKTIYFWDSPVKIIGIMEHSVSASAYQKVAPMILHSITKFNVKVILVRVNQTQNIGSSLAKIDQIVKEMNPNYPVERTFLDESFEKKFVEEKLLALYRTGSVVLRYLFRVWVY